MKIKIRNAHQSEGERIFEIWRDAVIATHHFLSTEDLLAIEMDVRAFLPTAPTLVAVYDTDEPLGFMLLNGHHLEALFVDPNYHGKGIGKKLIAHAREANAILTTDVNEQNSQASAFYKRLGFSQIGRSERDGQGRPYPVIHLQMQGDESKGEPLMVS